MVRRAARRVVASQIKVVPVQTLRIAATGAVQDKHDARSRRQLAFQAAKHGHARVVVQHQFPVVPFLRLGAAGHREHALRQNEVVDLLLPDAAAAREQRGDEAADVRQKCQVAWQEVICPFRIRELQVAQDGLRGRCVAAHEQDGRRLGELREPPRNRCSDPARPA